MMLYQTFWMLTAAVLTTANPNLFNKFSLPNPFDALTFREKCFGDLGCFNNGVPFYHPTKRPISLPPFDLKYIRTKFRLFTRSNNDSHYLLQPNDESLIKSPFNESHPTKFFIHGFFSDVDPDDHRHKMKDETLKQGDYNVIVVDWSDSNGPPYCQAVSNARVVGAQISQIIKFLQKKRRLNPETVHLIGHSLGGHVAGWTGEITPGIGRLTGLDAAGPYFTTCDNRVRLDITDAKFVDVIHTNIGSIGLGDRIGLGIPEPIGHQDFYVNGGEIQPGCEPAGINSTIGKIKIPLLGQPQDLMSYATMSCDHSRSQDYFIASMDKKCKFEAVVCDTYEKFLNGECQSNEKVEMGFYAVKTEAVEGKRLFLKTNAKEPFCL